MTWWQQFRSRFGLRKCSPIIPTQWGNVSESARYAAAMNMKHDPEKKAMVVRMIGEAEGRRRYPEAGWDE